MVAQFSRRWRRVGTMLSGGLLRHELSKSTLLVVAVLAMAPPAGRTALAQRDASRPPGDLSYVRGPDRTVELPCGGVSLAFSPDGTELVVGLGRKGKNLLHFWAIRSKTHHTVFAETSEDIPHELAFSPALDFPAGRDTVAHETFQKQIVVWKVPGGRRDDILKGNFDWIYSLAFTRDGKGLVFGDASGTLRVWERTPPYPVRVITKLNASATQIVLSPNGKIMAALSCPGQSVRLLEVVNDPLGFKAAGKLNPVPDDPVCMSFSADNRTLAVAYYSRHLQLWDVSDMYAPKLKTTVRNMFGPLGGAHIAFSPKRNNILVAVGQMKLQPDIWDTNTGRRVDSFGYLSSRLPELSHIKCLAFCPEDRMLVAIAGSDHVSDLLIWDGFATDNRLQRFAK